MNYQDTKRTLDIASWIIVAAVFITMSWLTSEGYGVLGSSVIILTTFILVFAIRRVVTSRLNSRFYRKILQSGNTGHMNAFIERVRTCFTLPDFINAIRENLEMTLDAAVILIKSNTWEPVYSSPATLTADPSLLNMLKRNFRELSEGFGYMDENFSLGMGGRDSRGVLIFCKGYYLFIFTRSAADVDPNVYRVLYAEVQIFFDRVITVSRLFEIAALSKEWRLIAETQQSFLPKKLPEHPKLKLAAYFRPLVHVSGDFYDAIKIDDDRVLLVMGDVSGKGLGAALIMGIAINTIRTTGDKTNLVQLLKTVDSAIRDMNFDDKYTVLFLGIADLKKNTLSYINAALPDQYLVVKTIRGTAVKRLESNHGIVGLVPIDEVEVEEVELRTDDVIILSSDGLTELENDEGIPLDQSPEWQRVIDEAHDMDAEELIERLATLGETYIGQRALRDDITILIGKVGRLWD